MKNQVQQKVKGFVKVVDRWTAPIWGTAFCASALVARITLGG